MELTNRGASLNEKIREMKNAYRLGDQTYRDEFEHNIFENIKFVEMRKNIMKMKDDMYNI